MKTSNSFEPLALRGAMEDATENTLHLDWCPFINLIFIGFILYLLSSKWICPPGVQVHLPKLNNSVAYSTALPSEDVLVIDKDLRIFFNHQLFNFQQVGSLFLKKSRHGVLTLKLDDTVPVGYVLKISEQARMSGYRTIQIAVDVQ